MSPRKLTTTASSSGVVKGPAEKNTKGFEVSHSKVKMARRCLKAYEYRYLRKLQKRLKSRPLIVGSLIHECLEMWFRDGCYLPAITKWKEGEYTKMFAEEQALHADVVPLAKSLIRGYIKTWEESDLEMVWVEREFRVIIGFDHLAQPIYLVGKIDGMARDQRKLKWLVEHKTCKKMPGEEVRIWDTQVLLYSGVLEDIGEPPVNGVVWDYVRTKLPTKPALLKSGGLSSAKSIDTTPEVYLREIKRHGFNPNGYGDILEHLAAKRDQFYRQVRLPLSNTVGQVLKEELLVTAQFLALMEMQYAVLSEEGLPTPCTRNVTRDCSWCDYSSLCMAELRGEDTSYLLKHDYIVRVKHGSQEEREVDTQVDTE